VQERRQDEQLLQQRYDDQRLETTELRRQLDEMRLIVDDNTTELELRRANDSLSTLRSQLDNAEKQVRASALRELWGIQDGLRRLGWE